MKIRTKIKFLVFMGFIISFTYQFEDFGFLNAFTNEKKYNKTDDDNSTAIINSLNNTNCTNTTDINSIAYEETKEVIIEDREQLNDDKQKSFLKKTKNVAASKVSDDNSISNDTHKGEKAFSSDPNTQSTNTETTTKNLRKETPSIKSEEKEKLKEKKITKESKELKDSDIGANLSEEEKTKLCEKLDLLLSKLTDFDINVSQLRADFMNYTKKFINHHYSKEKLEVKQELAKEKDDYLISYAEKMNDLNHLLQKYKLEIYVLKNKDQCPNKIKIILSEVQTNFLNLITIIKDEIKESKIPLNLLMINFHEKEDSLVKAPENSMNPLKDLTNNLVLSSDLKEELEDKGNVII